MNICPCCGQPVDNDDLLVSLDTNKVSRRGQEVAFPPQTVEIIHALNKVRPASLPHERLHDIIYGKSFAVQRSENPNGVIRVLICQCRKQLQPLGVHIVSVYGEGYQLVVE